VVSPSGLPAQWFRPIFKWSSRHKLVTSLAQTDDFWIQKTVLSM
jgi:hypothetical protein